MNRKKDLLAFLLAAVLLLSVSWGLSWVLIPVRENYGSMWDSYRQEETPIDVLCFGSSVAYCDLAPGYIWQESGLRTFVMAAPEQTMPFTYYAVREACRTQSPQVIAVEMRGMFFQKYQNYTKPNLTYMPPGLNRAAATLNGGERSEWFGSFFPLYNYHYRWTEVERPECSARLHPQPDPAAGYTVLTDRYTSGEIFTDDTLTADSDTYRENLSYLKKICSFCEKRDITLLLYLAPSCSKVPEAALAALRQDVEGLGQALYDLNEIAPSLDIVVEEDYYDFLHFNLYGAEKFSHWFAHFLLEEGGAVPTPGWEDVWNERVAYLENSKA